MLKGSSSNLGAFNLSAKSHHIEQKALQGDLELDGLFKEISGEYAGLKQVLEEVLTDSPS
jgi:HPt (histidine-containing phosphotransfer) domain-containing protein